MRQIKWIALVIIITVIAVFFTWKNLYSQQALAKRVPFQKGFTITQQKQIVDVNFIFQPSWVPEKDTKEMKEINQLVYQNYNSSIYLTSVYNNYDRNNEEGNIVANFEIKQNFNTEGGKYVSCYFIDNHGFTSTLTKVTGYDINNNSLDEDFGSEAGTGSGERFSIYLRAKELLHSPINIKLGPLNLVQYIKNS